MRNGKSKTLQVGSLPDFGPHVPRLSVRDREVIWTAGMLGTSCWRHRRGSIYSYEHTRGLIINIDVRKIRTSKLVRQPPVPEAIVIPISSYPLS